MKILMIGSGGREHALIKKLLESPKCTKLYCAPGNGGVDGAIVYHAGTKYENGKFYTNGGRVLGVTATADTLDEAPEKGDCAMRKNSFLGGPLKHDKMKTKK